MKIHLLGGPADGTVVESDHPRMYTAMVDGVPFVYTVYQFFGRTVFIGTPPGQYPRFHLYQDTESGDIGEAIAAARRKAVLDIGNRSRLLFPSQVLSVGVTFTIITYAAVIADADDMPDCYRSLAMGVA